MSRPVKITKLKLLRLLGVRELQTIVRDHELEARDGRNVDALIRAIQRARHIGPEHVVAVMRSLSEQRVKTMVEWLGVSAAGRRKNALLDALVLGAADESSEHEDEDEDEDEEDDRDSLTEDEQTLLDLVPEDGSSITNARLREALEWDEDDYWPVRDALVEKGFLAVGYGRGGSVYRLFDEDEGEEAEDDEGGEEETEDDDIYPDEASLYDGVRDMLSKNWQQLFPGFPAPAKHWVDSSPRQGRRETGGKWTRPDLSAVTINKYRYVPGTHLDVFTFEVKPRDQLNILGLYEALGHSRRGNFAYVLYHVPTRDSLTTAGAEKYERELKEIIREATRLKVGVATFEDPAQAETWSVHVVPSRHDTEARLLDEFIENLPEPIRRDIEFSIRS